MAVVRRGFAITQGSPTLFTALRSNVKTFAKHERKWNSNVFHRNLANVYKSDQGFIINIIINTDRHGCLCVYGPLQSPAHLKQTQLLKSCQSSLKWIHLVFVSPGAGKLHMHERCCCCCSNRDFSLKKLKNVSILTLIPCHWQSVSLAKKTASNTYFKFWVHRSRIWLSYRSLSK